MDLLLLHRQNIRDGRGKGMNNKKPALRGSLLRQKGQSMVEYTVVSVFGILVLTTGPGGDVVVDLTNAVRNNFDGYTYAVSLSDYPEKENLTELLALYTSQGMPDDQIDYLMGPPPVADIGELINEISQYNIGSFPSIEDGLNLLDDIGLSPGDFL